MNTPLNMDDDHRDDPTEEGSASFGIRAAERRAGIGRKDLADVPKAATKEGKLKKIIRLLLGDEDDELGTDAKQIQDRIEQQKELSPEAETPPEER